MTDCSSTTSAATFLGLARHRRASAVEFWEGSLDFLGGRSAGSASQRWPRCTAVPANYSKNSITRNLLGVTSASSRFVVQRWSRRQTSSDDGRGSLARYATCHARDGEHYGERCLD